MQLGQLTILFIREAGKNESPAALRKKIKKVENKRKIYHIKKEIKLTKIYKNKI
jgi:hypothetical protein